MINNSPFDDHIKKTLDHSRPDVPPHIWENIMAKKKRRPGIFLFSFLNNRAVMVTGLLIISIGSGLMVNHLRKSNNTDGVTKSVKGSNLISVQTSSAVENEPNQATLIPGNEALNSDGISTESSGNFKESQTNIDKTTPNNTDNKAKPRGQYEIAKLLEKESIKTRFEKSGNDGTAALSISGNNRDEIVNIPVNKKKSNETDNRGKRKSSSTAKFRMDVENGDWGSGSGSLGKAVEKYIKASDNGDQLLPHQLLYLTPQRTIKEMSLKLALKPEVFIKIPEIERRAAGNKKYFEFYGGLDYAIRSFSDTSKSDYLANRKASTTFTSAFSFGIRYTKVFNNAMSFRTGINFSQINEKFSFLQGQVISTLPLVSISGNAIGSYATTATRYKVTHNRYRTIDIPLLIGYEMGNKRFHSNINGGLVINAYSWQKGDILDMTNQPINITTGKSNSSYNFKNNIGVGFMGAASFYYNVKGDLHLLAEPYFRYNLSQYNKDEISLKQKYSTLGLRLGIRKNF